VGYPSLVPQSLARPYSTLSSRLQVSSVEIERAVMEALPDLVSEVAAIAVPPVGGGPETLVLVLVLTAHQQQAYASAATGVGLNPLHEKLLKSCSEAVRTRLNPLFKVRSDPPGVKTSHQWAHPALIRSTRILLASLSSRIMCTPCPALCQVSAVSMRTELPRTASNKVLRRQLRDELCRALSSRLSKL
jgi:acyl-CoA synthetase (AMP-forming)/AMP-acid ligase II